jgi:hypothetical protein
MRVCVCVCVPDLVLFQLDAIRQYFVLFQLQHDRIVQIEFLEHDDIVIECG